MDKLQSWIAQKGDGAATALDAHCKTLGWDTALLLAEIAGERKAKILEELATKRKQAEEAGVTKGEWERVKPKLDVAVEAAIVEEPK